MTCEQFSALMSGYLENTLTPQQREQADAHLHACPSCQLGLQILRDCQALDDGGEVPASFSSSWRQAIMEEEEQQMEQQTNTPSPRKPMRMRRFIALAASLVLVLSGAWLVGNKALPATRQEQQIEAYQEAGAVNQDGAPPRSMAVDAAKYTDVSDAMMAEEAVLGPEQAYQEPSQAKIIRTVSLRLATSSFDRDLEQLNQLLKEKGGYVEYSDISVDTGSRRYANFTLRVPKNRLDAYLKAAQGIGRTISFSESQEDVSEQYHDTDTRLATQKAKMERLQALLSKAMLVEDVLRIEREIADTQYQIDRLTGALRGMDSRVDYSTVSLSVTEEWVPKEAPAYSLGQRILHAVSDAWHAARTFLEQALIGLIVIAPYLLVLAVIIYTVYRLIKRRKNK